MVVVTLAFLCDADCDDFFFLFFTYKMEMCFVTKPELNISLKYVHETLDLLELKWRLLPNAIIIEKTLEHPLGISFSTFQRYLGLVSKEKITEI